MNKISNLALFIIIFVLSVDGLLLADNSNEITLITKTERFIQGKVIDIESGKPIKKFCVCLANPVRNYFTDPRSREFQINRRYEFNSETGEFKITDFDGDACSIIVKAEGYIYGIIWDYVIRGGKRWELSEMWREEPLIFKLKRGGIIRGKIMEVGSKKSIMNAKVILNDPMGDTAEHLLPQNRANGYLAETTTDADGNFVLEGIAFSLRRPHWLRVIHPRYLARIKNGIELTSSQPSVWVEIALDPAAGVTGKLFDLKGESISDATVVASVKGKSPFLQYAQLWVTTQTDKNGNFEISPLYPGICHISAYSFPQTGVVSMLGLVKDVLLTSGSITSVNLYPIKNGAKLKVKIIAKGPLAITVGSSGVAREAYGLVHPEDPLLLLLGIDSIIALLPVEGESCKIENLPAGTFYVHAVDMSMQVEGKGNGEVIVCGSKVNLAAGQEAELTIDLTPAENNPRRFTGYYSMEQLEQFFGDMVEKYYAGRTEVKPSTPTPSSEVKRPTPVSQFAIMTAERPTFTNSLGMNFVFIPAGSFLMGSHLSPEELAMRYEVQASHFENQFPQHKVSINKDFYLGIYEVTQAQWRAVMGNNPAAACPHGDYGVGDDYPIYWVSWEHCQEFIRRLNELEKTNTYRLPSEAEWEYACRAGSEALYYFGDVDSELGNYAWYNSNSDGKIHPVGLKKPNARGLYDMLGNVNEWCIDGVRRYSEESQIDPLTPPIDKLRIRRGGSFSLPDRACRCAARNWGHQDTRYIGLGFRLLKEISK